MKIAIIGSMSFAKEMLETKEKLGDMGHDVTVPCDADMVASGEHDPDDFEADRIHCTENDIIKRCMRNVESCDAVLALNHDKNGVEGYVGASTFAEIMFAHHLGKKIFLLNDVPPEDKQRHSHEIRIMNAVPISGDLGKIA